MIKDDIADQLVYSTVKITCQNSTEVSTRTGFFMAKELQNGRNIIAIVTNGACWGLTVRPAKGI